MPSAISTRPVRFDARQNGMLLSAFGAGETTTIDAKRIGLPLLFERLRRNCFRRWFRQPSRQQV